MPPERECEECGSRCAIGEKIDHFVGCSEYTGDLKAYTVEVTLTVRVSVHALNLTKASSLGLNRIKTSCSLGDKKVVDIETIACRKV